MLTAEQVKMARAGLGWGVRDLAKKAKVSTSTIVRLEAGEGAWTATLERVRKALERGGALFIAENGGPPGVRIKVRGRE